MYNHARTLLLNISGEGGSQLIYPGDELIPEDFRSVKLPTYLQVVRSILFGISPDRVMLNYRSCQFLRLIQSTELQSHITELDKRITYSPFDSRLLSPELFQPSAVASQTVEDAAIYINGSDLSPDASGRCEYSYLVSVLSGDLVVQRTVSPEANTVTPLTFTAGLSQEVELPYSAYRVRVNELSEGCTWRVQGYYRPSRSLSEIDESLRSIGQENVLQLFGESPEEPYLTFYNCWQKHPEFAYRLGGILLAHIYRTEETRNGG